MTLAQAQAAATTFRECLLDNGVRKVSIELQQGVAGSGWYVGTFKRGMGHHIASRPSQGLTPGLATVKNGRKGASPLTGPLANCYGGWDYVARIITLAWANHPGEGGPWTVPGWGTVPRNDGRPRIIGWEFEGGYEPYTDEMHDFMACCGAGTLDYLGTLPGNPGSAPLECWGEHKDPWAPGRKIDRLGYTAGSGRARIAAVRGTSTAASALDTLGEIDMGILKPTNAAGPIYLVTPFSWSKTNDIGLVELWSRGYGLKAEEMHQEQIDKLCRDSEARYRQLFGNPLFGNMPTGQNNFHWLAERMLEAVKTVPRAQVDAEALRAAILEAVSFTERGIAVATVDELDRRARDGDPATGPVT